MASATPVVVIGGGAAGFFAAITCAQLQQRRPVLILEKSRHILAKVRVSGGGRCNVTHACFDVDELVKNYPRGAHELIAPFHRFNPKHTIDWFKAQGVALKTEPDGRMFPVTDNSQTIVDCLTNAAPKYGVTIYPNLGITGITPPQTQNADWLLQTGNNQTIAAYCVLVASGSSTQMWQLLSGLGHTIETPVPSLFTFNIAHPLLHELAGITIPQVAVKVPQTKLQAAGNLLITHWGLSGPAVLRLSAWGARELHNLNYRFNVEINWINHLPAQSVAQLLAQYKSQYAARALQAHALFNLPLRLWKRLASQSGIPENLRWADVSKKQLQQLVSQLTQTVLPVSGKSTFKEEFVTCGGVRLSEVNFKTMESKLFPRLYFAGETLDIDAITGGFNFQAAWTCGRIAGNSMAQQATAGFEPENHF
ncbi:NAD(P)/FAD-dependent oxidoreductase [Sphingobacteriales bacterium UPWRP_1]|nr:flavoprotein [Sphingobacteriales bacterium TSM_CSM]PSJ76470.1 NAD(P)/FAD-dependent oxidoreductase [Sphingobacteriales bacterium UPWRP_1]